LASRSNSPEKFWLKAANASQLLTRSCRARRGEDHDIPCSADAAERTDPARRGTKRSHRQLPVWASFRKRREIMSPKVSEDERPTEDDLARQKLGPRGVPGETQRR
jgi:hypothetical protein